MRKIKANNVGALEELYDLYSPLLFGLISSIVRKRDEAEEVLQDVFIDVREKASAFDVKRGNVYIWIITIARNKAIEHIRSGKYMTPQEESHRIGGTEVNPEEVSGDPLETTIFSDRAVLLEKVLSEIPGNQSEVIRIAYYRGMTQTEVADYLGIPPDTVRMRMRQGLVKLKNILREYIS